MSKNSIIKDLNQAIRNKMNLPSILIVYETHDGKYFMLQDGRPDKEVKKDWLESLDTTVILIDEDSRAL